MNAFFMSSKWSLKNHRPGTLELPAAATEVPNACSLIKKYKMKIGAALDGRETKYIYFFLKAVPFGSERNPISGLCPSTFWLSCVSL